MPDRAMPRLRTTIPEGFAAVSLEPGASGASLQLAILVAVRADEVAGRMVELRTTPTARSLLGAVVDRGGQVVRWVELWQQWFDGLGDGPAAYREAWTNLTLEERWRELASAMAGLGGGSGVGPMVYRTAWERTAPPPMWIDADRRELVIPNRQGEAFEVCRDEGLLGDLGLPGFASSTSRYLWVPRLGLESPFVAATAATPVRGPATALEVELPELAGCIPFNPAGGLMMVRPLAALSLERYSDIVGGLEPQDTWHGRTQLVLDDAEVEQADDPSGLFLARRGRNGRLVEALHLKLAALRSAVAEVRDYTKRTGLPMLNVSAARFGVFAAGAQAGLAGLWSSRVALSEPGEAAELGVEGAEARMFIGGAGEELGAYRPRIGRSGGRGRGALRVRQVSEADGRIEVEATLLTPEGIEAARSDLAWLSLPIADTRIAMVGKVLADAALGSGEVRIRTVPQRVPAGVKSALESAGGVTIESVPYEVRALTSSPQDLYGLAVLGARLMLVDAGTTLAVAADELLSLAGEIGARAAEQSERERPLAERVGEVFEQDARWLLSLGPHRLVRDDIDPGDALAAVPRELWFEVLALLVQMVPGRGPDSMCRDLGDARPLALETIYAPALEELDRLLARSRSLIVVDWSANREVSAVLRRFTVGLGAP